MKTREALQAFGLDSHSPLAAIRDTIVQRATVREAERMAAARQRAQIRGGAGPLMSVLRKRIAEYSAQRLVNNAAPAITCADLHNVLKTASLQAQNRDRGLARAATHAYHLWTKNPSGSLSVGDVARMRAHYQTEYPRSKVGSVIDTEVPKVGYNTLPIQQLTRIAGQIQRAGGTQDAYNEAVLTHGLDKQDTHMFRCRAFIRSLIDGVAPVEQAPEPDLAQRVGARLATDADPILGRFAQFIEDDESEPMLEDTESIDSPITGEPLTIELSPELEDEDNLGLPMEDVGPLPQGMEVMGQLDDFSPESTVVMEDPTDPEGGELEVTVRPLEDGGPQPESMPELDQVESDDDALLEQTAARRTAQPKNVTSPDKWMRAEEEAKKTYGPKGTKLPQDRWFATVNSIYQNMGGGFTHKSEHEAKCGEDHDHTEGCYGERAGADDRHYAVYAAVNGRLSKEPLEQFRARGMGAALQHIASHGVTGHIHGDPNTLGSECYVALDNGNFLHVVAGKEPELKGKDEVFQPDVHDQLPAYMPKVDSDIMVGDKTMGQQAHPFEHLANAVVEGEIAKRAGWQLQVNGDAQVELLYEGKRKKTAGLADLDAMVQNFVSVSKPPPPPAMRYAAFRDSEHGGYVVVTDVPFGKDGDDLRYNAKRILRAVQKVIPAARGTLRKDAKLQLEFAANTAALGRVRHILEDQYRAQEYRIVEAQALDMPPSPGSAAEEGIIQPTPGAATQLPQNSAAPTGTIVPPAQGMQPAVGQTQGPVNVGPVVQDQPVVPDAAPQQQAQARSGAFMVTFKSPDGNTAQAPVQARTAALARELFTRFNDDCEILKVAQFMEEDAPGDPVGGGEDVALLIEDQLMDDATMQMPMMPQGPMDSGMLSPEETEAVRAALTHYRNQGLGPATALDQLMSQYSDLFNRHGDKTDTQRHEIEAEAMKLAAEIWTQPAMLDKSAQMMEPMFQVTVAAKDSQSRKYVKRLLEKVSPGRVDERGSNKTEVNAYITGVDADDMTKVKKQLAKAGLTAEIRRYAQFDPDVHTQQAPANQFPGRPHWNVPPNLGEDSETDTTVTDSLDAPEVNAQVPAQDQPGTSDSVGDGLGRDSETRDVGSFGAPKPKAQPDQQPQKGESWSSTDGPAAGLGKDSETDDSLTRKEFDGPAAKAPDALRSK